MVTLRPVALLLAAVLGVVIGWPALTSQPTGFVSSTDKAVDVPAFVAQPPAPKAPAVMTQGRPSIPSPPVLLALLRGTLAAVNQANVTGNYSVLRDLGAPTFRESYNAAELADRFRPWRDNVLDFAAVLLLDAKLSRPPSIGPDGLLRLAGYFPTAPLRIGFDLGFQVVGGNWRLATISVDAHPVTPEAGVANAAAAPRMAAHSPAPAMPGPVAEPAPVPARPAAPASSGAPGPFRMLP